MRGLRQRRRTVRCERVNRTPEDEPDSMPRPLSFFLGSLLKKEKRRFNTKSIEITSAVFSGEGNAKTMESSSRWRSSIDGA